MNWPDWMEPIRGPGEWFAFLGGLVVVGVIVAAAALMYKTDTRLEEVLCPPNDTCRRSIYRVVNDTDRAVSIDECFDHCADPERRDGPFLKPGETSSLAENYVGARIKEHTWLLVTQDSADTVGCLVLDGYKHKHDGDLVAVSAARPCRDSGELTPLLETAD